MAFIRVDKDLVNDPRIITLSEQLSGYIQISEVYGGNDLFEAGESFEPLQNRNALRNALLGALVTLWCYADTYIRSDDTLPISISSLSDVLGLPTEILEKLPPQWLTVMPDGSVKLPGYSNKNGILSKEKRREQTRDRVNRWRKKTAAPEPQRNASCNALQSVTSALPPIPIPIPIPIQEKTNPCASDDARAPEGDRRDVETRPQDVHPHERRNGSTLQDRFEEFWRAYPKKKSKGAALRAWNQIKPDQALLLTILAAIRTARDSPDWRKEGGQFVPYPATWLRAQGWEDQHADFEADAQFAGGL